MTLLALNPKDIFTDESNNELVHFTCLCNNRLIAICGFVFAEDDEYVEDFREDEICVVCDDLSLLACPFCGRE